ncbi:MAG TPA: hypothetical protein VK518_04185 [Puia sp.]|nr:hypothetical protein [Puia sp.]
MEKTFMKGLGTVVAVATVCLMSGHISSCGSTGGSGKTPTPKIIIVDSPVRAGSHLIIECPKCSVQSGKVDIGTVPFDIPANSEIIISFNDADSTKR